MSSIIRLPDRILLTIGPPVDKRPDSQLRTMTFDPDTGRLTPPEGIDFGGFQMHEIQFQFSLNNANHQKICDVQMSRRYVVEGLKAIVTGEGKDAPAVCRDVMASIESKLKLAARRKEAKEKRRRGSS